LVKLNNRVSIYIYGFWRNKHTYLYYLLSGGNDHMDAAAPGMHAVAIKELGNPSHVML
jgi:hypothetical protein